MRASRTWKRTVAGFMAAGLIAAACGSDDDGGGSSTDPPTTDAPVVTDEMSEDEPVTTDEMSEDEPVTTDEMSEDEPEGDGEALPTEGDVEVAAGTVLNLDDCPDDWSATTGVDGGEIRLGQSLPQSGALAAFGAIGEGMEFYFDYINDNEPVDGKKLVLVTRDDGYEAGRAVANVQEMIDTEDIFSFVHMIGTPINFAVRPITDDNCVPQLFNSSGFPFWGDPAEFPWTVGNILNYVTETEIWCQAIVDEFGEGASVASLIMNNDFGKTYQQTLEKCAADGQITIADQQLHDPAAPDVTNEMTTLIGTDADVFIAGTTAAFCPQTVGALAGSTWRPRVFMSYTCNNLSSFFTPVQDAAGKLAEEGSGVRMTNSNKVCGDPVYADDPAIQLIEQVLDEYGNVTCADGSYSTGVLYGQFVVDILRSAAALPGGLNRVNLMHAVWNADTNNDILLGGSLKLDGVNDAYWTEAAQIQEVVVKDGALTFEPIGDVIDFEGKGGSYQPS